MTTKIPDDKMLIDPPSASLAEELPNFMGLQNGEVDIISQEAVTEAIANKQASGLPISVWNNGNPYHKYPDGRIEYIQVKESQHQRS